MTAMDDTHEFQVPASDQKGHSVRKSVRISPQLDMQIDLILGSKKFPYRTEGELLRHAVMRHCRWLLSMQDSVESMMPQIESITQIVAIEEERRQFQEVMDKVVKEATSLAASGHIRKAREVVDKITTQASKISDAYWRGKYVKEIERKLGHLASKSVSLLPEDMVIGPDSDDEG